MRTRATAVTLVAALAGAVLRAEQQPPVRFKSEVNFVEIDAIVTDRNGRFVPGLTKEDFEIVEEGKPQPIAAFEMVHIPAAPPPDTRPTAIAASVEPDVVSNRQGFEGRLFLLVLDDLQTEGARTAFVRKAAREFIERHVRPHDLVAVSFTGGPSAGQDFTTSRVRLTSAIDRFMGTKLQSATAAGLEDYLSRKQAMPPEIGTPVAPPSDTLEAVRALRARTSLSVLTQLSEFLGGVRGRRKSLVYFGEGVDYDLKDAIAPDLATITRDVGGVQQAMRDVFSAATRNNVSIYVIDPRGLSTGNEGAVGLPGTIDPVAGSTSAKLLDESGRSHLSLRAMAEQTGGLAFLNTNDVSQPLARIIDDSSSFYILGYYAPAGRTDGRFRRVDVRVKRAGLQVRSRKGYYAPRRTAETTPAAGTGASAELLAALKSPVAVDALTLSASATAFQGQAQMASVALLVELHPGVIAFRDEAGIKRTELELHVAAADPLSKKAHAAEYHVAELKLKPDTYDAVTREGVRIIRRMNLPPGRYRLQIGVRDKTSGAIGTVLTDLDVPNLTKPPLEMSGIVVVSAAATRVPTVSPDATLDSHLPGAHTARRVFPLNDTLAVFAEIYSNDVSVPHRLSVKTTLTDEDGRTVFAATEERGSDELPAADAAGGKKSPLRWSHRVDTPAEALGSGRFVLRMEATRSTGGTISRAIAFEVQ